MNDKLNSKSWILTNFASVSYRYWYRKTPTLINYANNL